MNKDVIIVNNFYEDPYAIREQILSAGVFPFVNNVPGQRSLGVPDEQSNILRSKIENIIGTPITVWEPYRGGKSTTMNTCFQLITDGDWSWIHHDDTSWAGVLYLTPDPNPEAGTGLFTHIETGISEWDPKDPATDFNMHPDRFDRSKWRCNLEVKNQFNRLILYKSTYYHDSMIPGFGNNYIDGRLTQVFFFDT
jgi:hypothetical protein